MKSLLATLPHAARRLSLSASIGLALVMFWSLVALFGPALAPHPMDAVVSARPFDASSTRFWLGTDVLGRDLLSRVLVAGRHTVALAVAGAMLASTVGAALGLFATVAGRYVSAVLDRVMDALLSIPGTVLAVAIIAASGATTPLLLCTAVLVCAPGCYRLTRSLAADLQRREYVQTARLRGEGRAYIACVEILPNLTQPLLADAGRRFVFIVLLFSSLSVLGLGAQPPAPDLGLLVRENLAGWRHAATAVLAPAFAIATLTIGVALLVETLAGGDGRSGGRR